MSPKLLAGSCGGDRHDMMILEMRIRCFRSEEELRRMQQHDSRKKELLISTYDTESPEFHNRIARFTRTETEFRLKSIWLLSRYIQYNTVGISAACLSAEDGKRKKRRSGKASVGCWPGGYSGIVRRI